MPKQVFTPAQRKARKAKQIKRLVAKGWKPPKKKGKADASD